MRRLRSALGGRGLPPLPGVLPGVLYGPMRAALFSRPPEEAHELTLRALELGLYPRTENTQWPSLTREVMGLTFPNPVGIAAGFDKDARVPDAVLGIGCGFAEIGTVTPLPQPGNPRPRVFRLKRDRAMINRLGFNNGGHTAALARLQKRQGDKPRQSGIVGVNIGANKASEDRAADYVAGLVKFYDVADYFTVNVSSPNTPGLRDLQAPAALGELLTRVMDARAELTAANGIVRPVVVKLAPDVADEDLPGIVEVIQSHQCDGIALTNTTLSRDHLRDTTSPETSEAGGLSGPPLFARSTEMIRHVHRLTHGAVPLIGIGGIDSADRAAEKIAAGASLLQLYTGLVYEGPGLIPRILERLAANISVSA